jgi:hypothetical protein
MPMHPGIQASIHGWDTPIIPTSNNHGFYIQQFIFLSHANTRMSKKSESERNDSQKFSVRMNGQPPRKSRTRFKYQKNNMAFPQEAHVTPSSL